MKTRSSVRSAVPTFTRQSSFMEWARENLSNIESPARYTKREKTLRAIEIFECVLKNFHLYDNGCLECVDTNCYNNSLIFSAFSRIVYLRRERVDEEFFQDIDKIIDAFIEKNNDLIYFYANLTYTNEETIKLCEYYKKYYDTISPDVCVFICTSMKEKCGQDFSKCRFVYSRLGKYTPICITDAIDEWWAATKIQRWATNILHQPAVYPMANRIVMRDLAKEGLGNIFTEEI